VHTRAAFLLLVILPLGCGSRGEGDTSAADTAARPDTGAITGAGNAPHAPLVKVDTGAARAAGDSAARQKRP
jgi:hypothetical protein